MYIHTYTGGNKDSTGYLHAFEAEGNQPSPLPALDEKMMPKTCICIVKVCMSALVRRGVGGLQDEMKAE